MEMDYKIIKFNVAGAEAVIKASYKDLYIINL